MTSRLAAFASVALASASFAQPIAIDDPAWKHAGPGSFDIADGVATTVGGMGLRWYSGEALADGTLSFEFRQKDPSHNSGVFLRFPDVGDDPWVAVREGYEVQIHANESPKNSTGSIYDIQRSIDSAVNPVGEWNRYNIHTLGDTIYVVLNGKLINIFKTQPGRGDERGYFGFQNHDDAAKIDFRNVEVQSANDQDPSSYLLAQGITSADITRYTYTAAKQALAEGEKINWYDHADFGPAFIQTWMDTYEGQPRSGAALKGMLLYPAPDRDLVAAFCLETLRLVTATTDGVALDNTPFARKHGTENKILNAENALFNSARSIGWANADGGFDDPREIKGYGNLPHTKYHGYYRYGNDVVVSYTVHGVDILGHVAADGAALLRTIELSGKSSELIHHLADNKGGWAISQEGRRAIATQGTSMIEALSGDASLESDGDRLTLRTPGNTEITLSYSVLPKNHGPLADLDGTLTARKLAPLTKGGPGISPDTFKVAPQIAADDSPWVVDNIPLPPALDQSPYGAKFRIGDFDFFSDGDRAALCTWGGEVWIVDGLKDLKSCTWKRFAAGTFEPLGLKIVDDIVHLSARDGIYQLIDLNDDGEADHFKVFNYDVTLTANFHEFNFGLETDKEGNFYLAKAGPVERGGRTFGRVLPHNGTVLRLPADGSKLEVIATGLRAPGGVAIGPNGFVTTGENEGTWQPTCKINYFDPSQGRPFFGTEQTAQDLAGEPPTQPLMYLPMSWDNSGGSQIWVPEDVDFGIPAGTLLHMSYGKSSLYRTYIQEVKGKPQAAAARIPVQLGSSAQRALFGPDKHLWISGLRGWQTNAATDSAFQRIRYTGAPDPMPATVALTSKGVDITFSQELDEELAADPTSFTVEKWNYVRGPQYGSGHFSIDNPDEEAERKALTTESQAHRVQDPVEVTAAELLPDGKTIRLTFANLTTADSLEINYDLETTDGDELIGKTVQSIFQLP